MSDVSNEEMAAIKKTSRAKSNRSATERRKPWQPPSKLDAPEAPEGFKHRWIRAEVRGWDDRTNVSGRLREGYELVRKDEYPDFEAPVMDSGRYEGVFGVGGLLLARIPLATVEERTDYFRNRHQERSSILLFYHYLEHLLFDIPQLFFQRSLLHFEHLKLA